MKQPARRHRQLAFRKIYEVFADWSSTIPVACHKGCATCCTLGVTVSETEAELITASIREHALTQWIVRRLQQLPSLPRPICTTNEFAGACLAGTEADPGSGFFDGTCPFLDHTLCRIYPVRPFGCRSFISTTRCHANRQAELPSFYLSGVTAVSQVLEHLDQGRRWGHLSSLVDTLLREKGAQAVRPVDPLLTARPLPGFLLSDEDFPMVSHLLETIFAATLEETTIHQLLTGG